MSDSLYKAALEGGAEFSEFVARAIDADPSAVGLDVKGDAAQGPSAADGEADGALTVSDALARAKGALEHINVTIMGEVSEVNDKRGYKAVYFTVKDEKCSLPCMMWMNRYDKTGVKLDVGMLVRITGRFSVYPAQGRMNFDVFGLSLAGEGELRQRVARLARELRDEGLMDDARKRPVGKYPEVIGLVTSPRGAAVHDVLRTLRRRFPLARVVFAGVPVEGPHAPVYLAEGLACVADAGAQVILLVRGGGSFESLMPFNDESLARAIVACPVPVVTGIGHEPDTSIADMVADVRASTPTGAAQAVSAKQENLLVGLSNAASRMSAAQTARFDSLNTRIAELRSRPVMRDNRALFAADFQTLDYLAERLDSRFPARLTQLDEQVSTLSERLRFALPLGLRTDEARLEAFSDRLKLQGPRVTESAESRLSHLRGRLVGRAPRLTERFEGELRVAASKVDALSPLGVLARGYSFARGSDGTMIRSVSQVENDEEIAITVSDGCLHAKVTSKESVSIQSIDWNENNE